MNEFMKKWTPTVKDVNKMDLVLNTDYGHGIVSTTKIHASEGDTIYIREEKVDSDREPQVVALDRHQLYDLIFNFMSQEEIVDMAVAKAKASVGYPPTGNHPDYEDRVK